MGQPLSVSANCSLLDLDLDGNRLPCGCLVCGISCGHYTDLDLVGSLLGTLLDGNASVTLVDREILVDGYLNGIHSGLRLKRTSFQQSSPLQ